MKKENYFFLFYFKIIRLNWALDKFNENFESKPNKKFNTALIRLELFRTNSESQNEMSDSSSAQVSFVL